MNLKLRRLERLAIPVILTLAAIVLPLYAFKVYQKLDYTDFSVYHRAALRVLARDWSHVYTLQDGASPFRYAPILLPFFTPFGKLSLQLGSLVWYLLQYTWFTLGLLQIRRALLALELPKISANGITALSAIFILRFCLDTFTIGQISSLMFLAFAGAFRAWMSQATTRSSGWLFIPTLLKIGPGIEYLLFLSDGVSHAFRAWKRALWILLALCAASLAWIFLLSDSAGATFVELWRGWIQIVLGDPGYYDASHYGSQSIKSLLLRAANSGWLTRSSASLLWLGSVLLGSFALIAFWSMRRPTSRLGRGHFFCLGLFAYLWFMPETFKYGFTTLALPVALLFVRPTRLSALALGFGFLTLSFAGKDLMSDSLFFGLQRASIPLLSSFLLFVAVFREAWRESRPAAWVKNVRAMVRVSSLGPWEREPETAERELSLLLPVPLRLEDNLDAVSRAQAIVHEIRRSLQGADLEIVLIPYYETASDLDSVSDMKKHEALSAPPAQSIQISPVPRHWGRGAALREGFLRCHGRKILVTHFDQPCAGGFFVSALKKLDEPNPVRIVRANRRDPESRFRIPVRVLPLVYGRHRLGLLFNRLVRASLGIQTTDTHSGTFVTDRQTATILFDRQSSAGFLFDLELCLTSVECGLREAELPVTVHLTEEKTLSRMLHETFSILIGLPHLSWRKRRRLYRVPPVDFARLEVTSDDWGLSPGVNAGILELARRGVIRRVSLLADSRYLLEGLSELRNIPGIQLGLHFNLTYGKRHSSPGRFLLEWLMPAKRRALAEYVQKEFAAQTQRLNAAGIVPVYFDGHHHVHAIPGIIRCLSGEIRETGMTRTRLPYDPKLWPTSRLPLLIFSLLSKNAIHRAGLKTAPFFYPREKSFHDCRELLWQLHRLTPGTEVIVHPSLLADGMAFEYPDPYVQGRVLEFQALRQLAKGRS